MDGDFHQVPPSVLEIVVNWPTPSVPLPNFDQVTSRSTGRRVSKGGRGGEGKGLKKISVAPRGGEKGKEKRREEGGGEGGKKEKEGDGGEEAARPRPWGFQPIFRPSRTPYQAASQLADDDHRGQLVKGSRKPTGRQILEPPDPTLEILHVFWIKQHSVCRSCPTPWPSRRPQTSLSCLPGGGFGASDGGVVQERATVRLTLSSS